MRHHLACALDAAKASRDVPSAMTTDAHVYPTRKVPAMLSRIEAEEKPVLIPVTKAARMMSVSPELLYREIREKRFPHRRIGKRILVSRQYVESLAGPPAE